MRVAIGFTARYLRIVSGGPVWRRLSYNRRSLRGLRQMIARLMQGTRFRRAVGIFERVVLGTGIGLALLVAEQVLGRMQRRKS